MLAAQSTVILWRVKQTELRILTGAGTGGFGIGPGHCGGGGGGGMVVPELQLPANISPAAGFRAQFRVALSVVNCHAWHSAPRARQASQHCMAWA